jgi:hypothetical protein
MKTKLSLIVGTTAAVLCLSFGVARAQKNTSSSSSAAQTSSNSSNDVGAAKPGSSLGGGKYVAIVVSPEEAAKKYPPPNGKSYPNGMDAQQASDIGSAAKSGFIKSPYSSRAYDCRKIGKGTLLLDDAAKKVFVRP